jgi:hypothetical protein
MVTAAEIALNSRTGSNSSVCWCVCLMLLLLLLLLQVTEEMVWELFIQAGPVGQSITAGLHTHKGAIVFQQQRPHF